MLVSWDPAADSNVLELSHARRICKEVCYQERILHQLCALKEGVPCLQVSRMEFVLLWATFVAIMLTDLERGIGIGIVMAVLYFAYSYAQASPVTATPAGLDAQLGLDFAADDQIGLHDPRGRDHGISSWSGTGDFSHCALLPQKSLDMREFSELLRSQLSQCLGQNKHDLMELGCRVQLLSSHVRIA